MQGRSADLSRALVGDPLECSLVRRALGASGESWSASRQQREGHLIPIDVHDLLLCICNSGWSWKECAGALASEIPASEMGQQWRAANQQLAEKSDGFLAPYNPDLLEILTGRGSHTTAAVRAYKLGCKGIHDEVCNEGMISKHKILDKEPSMAEPLEKGMKYTVIKKEIVVACPRLMEILSRTGNASHGVARTQTALQGCKRVLTLAVSKQLASGRDDVWDDVAKVASIGMPPGYIETARTYCAFVKQWSGGKDGEILHNLEAYEKTLNVKRKIATQDLRSMASITFSEAPRYIPAMVKALLVAPSGFVVDGVASLFNAGDYHGLQQGGKCRSAAMEANAIMQAAHTFVNAYAVLSDTEKLKVTSELEVRCVMHTHSKKAGSRATFESPLHIAELMYEDVVKLMKANGRTVPNWSLLNPLRSGKTNTATSQNAGCGALREFEASGAIPAAEMESAGFVVGAVLIKQKECRCADDFDDYVIKDAAEQEVVLEVSKRGVDSTVNIHRAQLLGMFMIKSVEKVIIFEPGSYPDPSDNYDLMADIAKGKLKDAMRSLFKASSENFIKIVKRTKDHGVLATKDFKKGEMWLVLLSTQVVISKKQMTFRDQW